MKNRILTFLLFVLCASAWALPESPYVSVHRAVLSDGALFSPSEDFRQIHAQVRAQLQFLVGTFNEWGGGAAIDYARKVNLTSIEKKENGFLIRYRAELLVAWNRKYKLPEKYEVTLPERADATGLQSFFNAYGKNCSEEKNAWPTFFYYYRPNRCGLGKGETPKWAMQAELEFGEALDHSGKHPEYDLAWSDGALNGIAIFGNTQSRDANQFFSYLRQWFGRPTADHTQNHGEFNHRSVSFQSQSGPVNMHILSITDGNLSSMGDDFRKVFDPLSQSADYITYNGHSGLGANVRALFRLGAFVSDQYKLYYFNGCDSFSYVTDELTEKHAKLNPEAPKAKYLDMVATVLPSLFSEMAYGSARVVWALTQRKESFTQILSQISNASPVVLGEEDNE